MPEIIQHLTEILSPLSPSAPTAFFIFFALSFFIGIISAVFGIGGGFFFTPFFHSFIGLSAVEAVATSMFQIPFMSASGSIGYLRRKKVETSAAMWLLLGAIPSSQITAWLFSHFSSGGDHAYVDLFLMITFSVMMTTLGLYTIFKKSDTPQDDTRGAEITENLQIPKTSIFATGLAFGFIASALGVGGGFLTVPYFIHVLKMPAVKASATSLFAMFFISLITSLQYLFLSHVVIVLSLFAALGTVLGAQFGSRIAVQLPPVLLKKSFGFLQIIVVILYLIKKLS